MGCGRPAALLTLQRALLLLTQLCVLAASMAHSLAYKRTEEVKHIECETRMQPLDDATIKHYLMPPHKLGSCNRNRLHTLYQSDESPSLSRLLKYLF